MIQSPWRCRAHVVRPARVAPLTSIPRGSFVIILAAVVLLWLLPLLQNKETSLSAVATGETGGQSRSTEMQQHAKKETADIDKMVGTLAPRVRWGDESSLVESERGRRLIFIGDIHGCLQELHRLTERLDYDAENDHIVVTGDIINKGPDSGGVIDFLRANGASCVRGNHDDSILRKVSRLESRSSLEALSLGQSTEPEWQIAQSLTPDQISYLRGCPIILQIGRIKSAEVVVVHGGLVPSIPLALQNAHDVMNMRIIHTTSLEPSRAHQAADSVAWSQLWNTYQDMSIHGRFAFFRSRQRQRHGHQPDDNKMMVIYGHDARSGLQIQKYTRGLDSACVAGGKLTALIINSSGDEELVQEECQVHHS